MHTRGIAADADDHLMLIQALPQVKQHYPLEHLHVTFEQDQGQLLDPQAGLIGLVKSDKL